MSRRGNVGSGYKTKFTVGDVVWTDHQVELYGIRRVQLLSTYHMTLPQYWKVKVLQSATVNGFDATTVHEKYCALRAETVRKRAIRTLERSLTQDRTIIERYTRNLAEHTEILKLIEGMVI